jgi:hypothetical protein
MIIWPIESSPSTGRGLSVVELNSDGHPPRADVKDWATGARGSAHPAWAIAAFACSLLVPCASAFDDPPRQSGPPPSSNDAPARPEISGAAALEKMWPGHPEWLAMLTDILVKGERLSGGDGWFRNRGPQTRFDWQSTRDRLDRDGDGMISRAEFPGLDTDFARLDRDRDAELTGADFDFSSRSSAPSPGTLLFGRADRDGNGRITPEELSKFFKAADRGGLGFLSRDDLQQALESPAPLLRGSPGAPDGPTRKTFLSAFFRGELGGLTPGPDLNQAAPDFTLKTADGRDEVTLSRMARHKPVVLVFGNYTCRPFRGQGGNLEKLHQRYKNRATFLAVYVREAHPSDGWRMEVNDALGVTVRQPKTYSERVGVAQVCTRNMGLSFPVLVDTIEDAVNKQYCGVPSRLYLVDRHGKIAYKSARGPFGFNPAELEHSLMLLLQQDSSTTTRSD